MATWIAHLRIAEHFMNKYPKLNCDEFLVGNIAPDCGVLDENGMFTPSKKITHWLTEDIVMDAEGFRAKHLDLDDLRCNFYLGYYFHLITDNEWMKLYRKKMLEPAYVEGFKKYTDFTTIMKEDWYGQDQLYLMRNPGCVFFTRFTHIEKIDNIYFEDFGFDIFTNKVKEIAEYYLNAQEDENREFKYLSKMEMDLFVENTISLLDEVYREIKGAD